MISKLLRRLPLCLILVGMIYLPSCGHKPNTVIDDNRFICYVPNSKARANDVQEAELQALENIQVGRLMEAVGILESILETLYSNECIDVRGVAFAERLLASVLVDLGDTKRAKVCDYIAAQHEAIVDSHGVGHLAPRLRLEHDAP